MEVNLHGRVVVSSAAARDPIADPWGAMTPVGLPTDGSAATGRSRSWRPRVDSHLTVEPDLVERWLPSACLLYSNGCGLEIAVAGGRMVGVRGLASDRVNHGRLGPKGLLGWQANGSPDRLTDPLVRRDANLEPISWDEAMDLLVRRSRQVLDEVGPLGIGFYTSGQLMLEEYYTLAVMGKAGLGTPHMDGNTRLCTATAAAALKASFGTDGQPGTYTDIDHCDTVCLYGHNVAETQSVLWMRMLDRLEGPDPPRLVVVDPRPTVPARRADIHLAPRPGTNVALMNALLHELLANEWIDRTYVESNTIGFSELTATVESWTAEKAATVCQVDAALIRAAAHLIGHSERLVSTVLQGFYQSHQATAASVQVNNIHLLRGMLGRPGCGMLQMNGQPTAQNTRETGADGDLPGFRNWDNKQHIEELARLWNVDPAVIPHWSPPTHAMQIWRYAEQGSIRLLWISATNPAVSLPDLARVRRILTRPDLFIVVQDAFLSETAELADLVLPAALWGEKTGTFTNADRTVHLGQKAAEPPGRARADLDIFLDYSRRMDFSDLDRRPLIKWQDAESAFEAWKECSRGRPCDYTGITYDRLREGPGIQWPCPEGRSNGAERLYTDARFNTSPEDAETWGNDLATGAAIDETRYRALAPNGRAFLHAADYEPPVEAPDSQYPYVATTGRTLYHFHTRTKTRRARELQRAAPEVWVGLAAADAEREGIAEADLVEIDSRRGRVLARARLTAIRQGLVFLPFHYGGADAEGRPSAANELTLVTWDPVSKQPQYKHAAVAIRLAAKGDGSPSAAPRITASQPLAAGTRRA